MKTEKLIEAVRLCGSTPKVDQCKRCAYWAAGDMSKCIPRMTTDAATALSMLRAENEKLREMYQKEKSVCHAVQAELEKVMRERDTAVERIREWEKFDTYLLVHSFITPEKWRSQNED